MKCQENCTCGKHIKRSWPDSSRIKMLGNKNSLGNRSRSGYTNSEITRSRISESLTLNIPNLGCGVYLLLNLENSKCYIGSSADIRGRFIMHLNDFKNHQNNRRMQKDFDLGNTFVPFVLEECTEEFLLEKEQFWFDNAKPEYNIAQTARRHRLTPKSKELISMANMKRKGITKIFANSKTETFII